MQCFAKENCAKFGYPALEPALRAWDLFSWTNPIKVGVTGTAQSLNFDLPNPESTMRNLELSSLGQTTKNSSLSIFVLKAFVNSFHLLAMVWRKV